MTFATREHRPIVVGCLLLLFFCQAANSSSDSATDSQDASAAVAERGTFRLHKFQALVGEERYDVTRQNDTVQIHSTFQLSYLGGKVAHTASMVAQVDGTPVQFAIKGDTSTQSKADVVIAIQDGKASVTEDQKMRQVAAPPRFFTTIGYAPIWNQERLLRYWLRHGKPTRLALLPRGSVTIVARGRDVIEVAGTRTELSRYSVEGLIWGREIVWLDASERLIAVVTVDAEFDHFEAVREGFEAALPVFVRRAADDTIAQLADLSRQLQPEQRGSFAILGATLIDGTGKAAVADSAVIIEGDRIRAVGRRDEVKVPKGMTQVDGRGKYLLPGLWDMHAHYAQVEWGPAYLAAGVTSARDCGNDFDFVVPLRSALDANRILGPRLLLAGYLDGDGETGLGSTTPLGIKPS